MSKLRNPRWTLVQHSKYAAHQDPRFRDVVEPASLSTHQQLGEVDDAGGCLFTSYSKAEDAADEVSEPALNRALPLERVKPDETVASLTFNQAFTIGGRSLYIPPNGVNRD